MFFQSKQKQVESEIARYCQTVIDCVEQLRVSLQDYCRTNDRQVLYENMQKVHKHESIADDIRCDIGVLLYTKSLFPESRGDMLALLESLDKVPNTTESVTDMLWTRHIVVPDEFTVDIARMMTISQRCVVVLLEGVAKLFDDFTNATMAIGKIDGLETEVDHIQAAITERLFASDRDTGEKLLLCDFISRIASISDRAENAGDRIRIIVAKRRL